MCYFRLFPWLFDFLNLDILDVYFLWTATSLAAIPGKFECVLYDALLLAEGKANKISPTAANCSFEWHVAELKKI